MTSPRSGPKRSILFIAVVTWLGFCVPTSRGEWFGGVYKNRIEFAVTARADPGLTKDRGRQYVLLTMGASGEVTRQRPAPIDNASVWKTTAAALDRAGFVPATSAESADIAIVVAFARGEYPPPFAFMSVDPEAVASFRWPRLLQQYDEQYYRRDYFEADVSGGIPGTSPATDADRVNFVSITAFDAHELRAHKTWSRVWETRITIAAKGRPLELFLPAMIAAGIQFYGRDNRSGVIVSAPVRKGVVELGELTIVESPPRKDRSAAPRTAP